MNALCEWLLSGARIATRVAAVGRRQPARECTAQPLHKRARRDARRQAADDRDRQPLARRTRRARARPGARAVRVVVRVRYRHRDDAGRDRQGVRPVLHTTTAARRRHRARPVDVYGFARQIEVLSERGYAALEAADGASGLRVLQSDARIDLLVTDVGLPGGMNGRQMADAARCARPDLRVPFITGYAENAVVGNGHLAAGMHVMTKPFAMEALASRIRELIAKG